MLHVPGHTPAVERLDVSVVLAESRGGVGDGVAPLLTVQTGLGRVQEARNLRWRRGGGRRGGRGREGAQQIAAW